MIRASARVATVLLITFAASALQSNGGALAAIQFDTPTLSSPATVISEAGSDAGAPVIVESDGTLVAVWRARAGQLDTIMVSSSRDRGVSWTNPREIGDAPGSDEPPLLATQGGVFTAAWLGTNDGDYVIEVSSSTDGGETWDVPRVMSGPGTSDPLLTAHTDGFTIAWEEDYATIVTRTSFDDGATWSSPSTVAVMPPGYNSPLELAVHRDALFLFWVEQGVNLGGPDTVWLARSFDDGMTWNSSIRVLEADDTLTHVWLAETPGGVAIAWNAVDRTVVVTSVDGGENWVTPTSNPFSALPSVALRSDDDVMFLVSPERAWGRISTSLDGGLTWSAALDVGDGPGSGFVYDVMYDEGALYATVFQYETFGVMTSSDFGQTWTRSGPGPESAGGYPQLVASDGVVFSYWTDAVGGDRRLQISSVLAPVRIGGADRYETARVISREFESFGGRAGSFVYIATGADFPDALVAASAAAHRKGPLLLTRRERLDEATIAELRRLDPDQVVIVGGTAAVSATVRSQAASVVGDTKVTQLGGENRYETARLVVQDAFPNLTTVYLATGGNFADALAATSAAASVDGAVMITDGTQPNLGADALWVVRGSFVRNVAIAGGTAVVSTGVESELVSRFGRTNVVRYAGENRYETSMLMNAGAGPFTSTAYFASGESFPDALGGAALAGATGAALFTVRALCVPPAVLDQLRGMSDVVVLGGPGVLGDQVRELQACSS